MRFNTHKTIAKFLRKFYIFKIFLRHYQLLNISVAFDNHSHTFEHQWCKQHISGPCPAIGLTIYRSTGKFGPFIVIGILRLVSLTSVGLLSCTKLIWF